jgi:periplasmic divalent cation tolerance protein
MGEGARFIQVSCAAGSQENARDIAVALIEQRLAACVHVMPIESHYRWQGQVHHDPEFLLQAKTTAEKLAAIEDLIKRLHSYELPEISVTAIIGGAADYLAWIADCVTPASQE